MKKRYLFTICMVLVALLLSQLLNAQTKQLINYQGKLVNKNGNPITDKVQTNFYIYSLPTGGTALWKENQVLTVTNGVFSVLLGSVEPIADTLFLSGRDRFLGIQVGTDPEMTPRFQITSVPMAIQAMNVPAGVIVMWSGAMDKIPFGWALCDGQEYSRSNG